MICKPIVLRNLFLKVFFPTLFNREETGSNHNEDYTKRSRALVSLDLDEEGGDEGPRQAVNAMLLKELIQREKPDYISDGIISDEAFF